MRLGEPLRLLGGLPPAEPLRLRGELTPRGLLIQEKGRLGTPSLPGEAPLLQRDNVVRRETLSLPQCNAPHGPHPGNHHRRDQDHGLLMARLLLQERKKKLKTPQFRPQSRLWLTLLSPTSRTLSPRRLRSPPGLLTCRFRLVSLTQRFLRDLSWAGPRLCQTPLPKPKRNSPREFKRAEPAIRCFLLLTALRRSPTLLLRARNLSQTRTCLTSSETRSLISAFFPSRLRKASPWKGLFALYWSPRVSLHGR